MINKMYTIIILIVQKGFKYMKITVSKRDLLDVSAVGFESKFPDASPELLLYLKNNGVPIKGVMMLYPDTENYNWNYYVDEYNYYIQWNAR